ncbi:imm11 family protein [Psychromonas algicola]|uniref:imm11 family protein n=1 Tax=Psychromonas algicola TaxID=2555642 RepID=UPI00403E4358
MEKKNYFYINPLGSFDCLDKEESVIKYNSEGKVIAVRHFVFDQKKMATLPDIFRVKESEKKYFINQRLVDEIKRRLPNVTNLNLETIEVV